LNNHDLCPPEICSVLKLGKLSENGQKVLEDKMEILSERAEYVCYYLSSNIAESFMSILNMMLGGRRVNNQQRGMFTRQARMAALIMSEGYSRHGILLLKMGIEPTDVLEDLAKNIRNRQYIIIIGNIRYRHSKKKIMVTKHKLWRGTKLVQKNWLPSKI
jgi:hypothetical protein